MQFLFGLALLAASVLAQDPTSSGSPSIPSGAANIPPCLLNCIAPSLAGSKCTGPEDRQCLCTDQTFQKNVLTCLQAQPDCASQLQTIASLQAQQCSGLSASGSGSGASAPPSTAKPTGSGGSSSPTGSAAGGSASGTSSATGLDVNTGLVGAAVLGLIGFAL